jgi:hypothetical protein
MFCKEEEKKGRGEIHELDGKSGLCGYGVSHASVLGDITACVSAREET